MTRQLNTFTAIACWLLLAASGVAAFWRYELTPGEDAGVVHRWPTNSALQAPGESSELLMFVHPRCGCTAAGINELKTLLQRVNPKQQPRVTFVLLQPAVADPHWIGSNNETLCRQFSNSQIFYDSSGAEADRFGIATSGMCLFYSADGKLLFSGGITSSRGHQGPSLGQEYLQSCMESNLTTFRKHPAFGCPLTSQTELPSSIVTNR